MKRRHFPCGCLLALGLIGSALAQAPAEPTPSPAAQALEEAREALRAAARHYAEALEAEGLRPPRWSGEADALPLPGLRRGFLGLRLGRPQEGEPGLPIVAVAEDSGAAEAGLRAGDRLLQINGQVLIPEAGADRGLGQALRELRVGENATVVYLREGQARTATVRLGPAPGLDTRRWSRLLREGSALLPIMDLAPMNPELGAYFGGQDRGVLVLSRRVLAGIELQGGDIIVAVNGEPVESPYDLARRLWQREESGIRLTLLRGGARLDLAGDAPPADPAVSGD